MQHSYWSDQMARIINVFLITLLSTCSRGECLFGRELINRQRSSWLPEGEAPPPYHGVLGVCRHPFQPLQVQQSYPHLPSFGYRLVGFIMQLLVSITALFFIGQFHVGCLDCTWSLSYVGYIYISYHFCTHLLRVHILVLHLMLYHFCIFYSKFYLCVLE